MQRDNHINLNEKYSGVRSRNFGEKSKCFLKYQTGFFNFRGTGDFTSERIRNKRSDVL